MWFPNVGSKTMKMLGGADGINSDIISLNNGNSSSVINVKYEH